MAYNNHFHPTKRSVNVPQTLYLRNRRLIMSMAYLPHIVKLFLTFTKPISLSAGKLQHSIKIQVDQLYKMRFLKL